MNRAISALFIMITIIGCGGTARVEIGVADPGVGRGVYGNISMRVLKIELPDPEPPNSLGLSVWEGATLVELPIHADTFVSVTNDYVDVEPGEYGSIALTVDSVCYVGGSSTIPLVDTVCQFTADAFIGIILEEGDELRLRINIASDNWFDADSIKVKTGHNPFEGASVGIYYNL